MFCLTPHTISQGPNWSQAETADLIALWGSTKVQSQFAWGRHSNTQIYKALEGHMQDCRHKQLVWQCFNKG